jgi:hypothetical protein
MSISNTLLNFDWENSEQKKQAESTLNRKKVDANMSQNLTFHVDLERPQNSIWLSTLHLEFGGDEQS